MEAGPAALCCAQASAPVLASVRVHGRGTMPFGMNGGFHYAKLDFRF